MAGYGSSRGRVARLLACALAVALVPVAVVVWPPVAVADGEGEPPEVVPYPSTSVGGVSSSDPENPGMPSDVIDAPVWPVAGSETVSVPVGGGSVLARPGGLSVWLRQPTGSSAPASVRVTAADPAVTEAAGVMGVLFTVGRADGVTAPGSVAMDVSYHDFRHAYGGDFGARLLLVRLPDCALTTPSVMDCQVQIPVTEAVNTSGVNKVTVDGLSISGDFAGMPGAAPGSVFALAAGPSSGAGDYKATSLSPAYSWSAGGPGGEFGTSYPIPLPPAPGGLAPEVTLGYSSGAVDGKTNSTNNQPSWVGEGWSLEFPYIERSYRSCRRDGQNVDDLCVFDMDNLSIVFGGRSSRLVKDGDGSFHPLDDDGIRVERLLGGWSLNQVWQGEHWKVTTQDGTQYWFGMSTTSTLDVPVISDDPNEPALAPNSCHTGVVRTSHCGMAYRWNLDRVLDRHGNRIQYYYQEFRQNYGYFNNYEVHDYALFAVPTGIEYGYNPGGGAPNPAARVEFTHGPRCLQEPCYTYVNNYKWYDTPWDLNCPLSFTSCPGRTTPTFWWSVRLVSVATQVRNTSGGWSYVDRFDVGHYFPGTWDTSSMSLWANGITHTGLVGGSQALPKLDFVGTRMANRVDHDGVNGNNGRPPLNKYRITRIISNSGRQTDVAYYGAECTPADTSVYQGSIVKRCFAVKEGTSFWFHKYTVASVTEKDLTGGSPEEKWSYTYSTAGSTDPVLWRYASDEHLGEYEQSWSIWAGYSNVRVTHGTTAGAQTVTESRYYRGLYGDRASFSGQTRYVWISDSQSTDLQDHRALAGRLREQTQFDGTAIVSSTIREPTVTTTAFRDRTWLFGDWWAWRVDETKTRTRVRLNHSSSWRWTETQTTYDSYGLPVDVRDLGWVSTDPAAANDDVCTHIDYARNTTPYLIDFPSQVLSTNCATSPSGPDYLAGGRTLYDGSSTVGSIAARGLVTKTLALASVSGTTLTWAQTARANTTSYDAHGRPLEVWDALDRRTATSYIPSVGGPTTATTVTNPASHATTTTLDRHRGVPTQIVDANGKTTTVTYDALGRLLKVWLPGRSTSLTGNVEYTYTLRSNGANTVTTRRLGPNGNQIVGVSLYDGRFRARQTQAVAPDGKRVVADTAYDNRGLVVKTSLFYNSASAPAEALVSFTDAAVLRQTSNTHDQFERLTNAITRSAGAELWRTTIAYDGDRLAVTPPAGGTATTTISDARGRLVELRQHTAATPTGAYDATFYEYDRLGRLTKVTDPVGNHWDYTIDLRGRQTQVADPDKGAATMTYDNAGQLETATDARGVTIAQVYDNLGRVIERRENGPTGPLRASWTYDTLALGQPTSAMRFSGGNAYTTAVTGYTDLYQPTGSTVTIPAAEGNLAGSYAFGTTYKVDGSIATQTLPAAGGLPAETIATSYADTGLPTSVTGLAAYLSTIGYDWDGQVRQQTLGTGTNRVLLTNVYQSSTGRLHKMQVHTEHPSIPNTWDEKFTESVRWSNAGTLSALVEQAAGTTVSAQCFDYDHLQRLKEAWTNATWSCVTAPAAVTNRGPDAYWTTWTFDETGNRMGQVAHSTVGGADTTTTYAYPAAGAARPHGVLSATGPGGTKTYGYDSVGNTTSRPGPTGVAQTLTWDPEGHLATVAGSSYLYDAGGQRLIARDPGVTTLYLPGCELRLAGGQVTATRYYPNAVRTTAGGLIWVAADHHGTNQLTVNPTTLAVTRRKSLPYGEQRGTQPASWPDQKGFVGGTQDPTGLTHLGAREYDPAIGRFISVDPVMLPTDPQQMHGYAYANNNPTTSSDPGGLCRTPCTDDEFYGTPAPQCTGTPDRCADRAGLNPPTCTGTPDRCADRAGLNKTRTGRKATSPPTIKEVLDELVRHGSRGELNDVEDLLEKLCQSLGPEPCKAVKQAFDQVIPRIAGEPFPCHLFPNADQCLTDIEGWAKDAFEHLEATVGYCAEICASLEFQGWNLHLVAGFGSTPGWSGSLVWHSETYAHQAVVGVEACKSYYAGVCVGVAPKVDDAGEWTGGSNWTVGIAFGMTEAVPLIGYTVANYNFDSRTWTVLPNPLPPSLWRTINGGLSRACERSWFC